MQPSRQRGPELRNEGVHSEKQDQPPTTAAFASNRGARFARRHLGGGGAHKDLAAVVVQGGPKHIDRLSTSSSLRETICLSL